MTNSHGCSRAFMLDDDEVCITYLDSIPAQGWSTTSAGNTQVTAARVLLASRQPRTGQRRTWGNPAPARP